MKRASRAAITLSALERRQRSLVFAPPTAGSVLILLARLGTSSQSLPYHWLQPVVADALRVRSQPRRTEGASGVFTLFTALAPFVRCVPNYKWDNCHQNQFGSVGACPRRVFNSRRPQGTTLPTTYKRLSPASGNTTNLEKVEASLSRNEVQQRLQPVYQALTAGFEGVMGLLPVPFCSCPCPRLTCL